MTKQPNRSDLETLEGVLRNITALRDGLKAIAELDGVAGALELVDQLGDAVEDIAADVEMELNEKGRR